MVARTYIVFTSFVHTISLQFWSFIFNIGLGGIFSVDIGVFAMCFAVHVTALPASVINIQ